MQEKLELGKLLERVRVLTFTLSDTSPWSRHVDLSAFGRPWFSDLSDWIGIGSGAPTVLDRQKTQDWRLRFSLRWTG